MKNGLTIHVLLGLSAVAALLACQQKPTPQVSPSPATTTTAPAPAPSLPASHPPVGALTQATLAPPPPGSGAGDAALHFTMPPAWVSETPASAMRRAQYRVPGPAGDAECVVFYFGPGQGGDARSNAERWASQFTPPEGVPTGQHVTTTEKTIAGIKVLHVEARGAYTGGMAMGGPAPEPQKDSMLLGAIAEGPDANWFFKLTGPEATVKANRDAFEAMIASIRKGE